MPGQKNKRAKACDISQKVKAKVYERDEGLCILCSRPGNPWCHFISRAHGGMGIPENIVTLCNSCHDAYDHGDRRKRSYLKGRLSEHLKGNYPKWSEEKLIYRKYPERSSDEQES